MILVLISWNFRFIALNFGEHWSAGEYLQKDIERFKESFEYLKRCNMLRCYMISSDPLSMPSMYVYLRVHIVQSKLLFIIPFNLYCISACIVLFRLHNITYDVLLSLNGKITSNGKRKMKYMRSRMRATECMGAIPCARVLRSIEICIYMESSRWCGTDLET